MNAQNGNKTQEQTSAAHAGFIAWNTGRHYTEHGQRMAARIVGDVVLFADVDRCIHGAFKDGEAEKIISAAAAGGRYGFQSAVMAAYDAGAYAWEGVDVGDEMSATKNAALLQYVPAEVEPAKDPEPTNAARVYPAHIVVWIDGDGHKCAAQAVSDSRILYHVRRENAPDNYGAIEPPFIADSEELSPEFFEGVFCGYRAKVSNLGQMSWIESRELSEAARDQNPEPTRYLSDAVSYPERVNLDDATRAELVKLLTKHCQAKTRYEVERALQDPARLRSHWGYSRLTIRGRHGVEYCAGQDYPRELAQIRAALIK